MVKAVPHEILTAGSNSGLIFLLLVCDVEIVSSNKKLPVVVGGFLYHTCLPYNVKHLDGCNLNLNLIEYFCLVYAFILKGSALDRHPTV